MTHYAMNSERSAVLRASMKSLFESTNYPFELIVIDNGGASDYGDDSDYFESLVALGKINTLITNAKNMHFGYARNQGIALAQGDYICIADNDLLYKKDWLKSCIEALEEFPGEKVYATPMKYPTLMPSTDRYAGGILTRKDGSIVKLNLRAGSNCFVIRRKDLQEIGLFKAHRIAGSLWTDDAVYAGYKALVVPGELVDDLGLRRGYNLKESIPIKLELSNGSVVNFNRDSLYKENDPNYADQKSCFKI
jgi:glycosyltransferase involved in cell wall biosynthesis